MRLRGISIGEMCFLEVQPNQNRDIKNSPRITRINRKTLSIIFLHREIKTRKARKLTHETMRIVS